MAPQFFSPRSDRFESFPEYGKLLSHTCETEQTSLRIGWLNLAVAQRSILWFKRRKIMDTTEFRRIIATQEAGWDAHNILKHFFVLWRSYRLTSIIFPKRDTLKRPKYWTNNWFNSLMDFNAFLNGSWINKIRFSLQFLDVASLWLVSDIATILLWSTIKFWNPTFIFCLLSRVDDRSMFGASVKSIWVFWCWCIVDYLDFATSGFPINLLTNLLFTVDQFFEWTNERNLHNIRMETWRLNFQFHIH